MDEDDHRVRPRPPRQVQVGALRAGGAVAEGASALEQVEDQAGTVHSSRIVTEAAACLRSLAEAGAGTYDHRHGERHGAAADLLSGRPGDRGGGLALPVRAGSEHRQLGPVLHAPRARHASSCAPPSTFRRSRTIAPRSRRRSAPSPSGSGCSWRIAYARDRRRVALMASREDHCLLDLLWRNRRGELDMDVVCVISNHEDVRGEVRGAGRAVRAHPRDQGDEAAGRAAGAG